MTYGWRAKIGLLVPAMNTTMEYDFNRLAPEGVSIHVSRVATEAEGTIEALEDMGRSAIESARLLAPARPDVVVFGCTSASFISGMEWTAQLESDLATAASCPVVSTASAMVAGLKDLNALRVAVLTPYVRQTNERLSAYLANAGIEVVDLHGLEMLDMYSHAEIPSEHLFAEAKALKFAAADAIFIACTQLKAIDIIDRLEQEVGRPVITAVQASLYAALRETGDIGLPIHGFGALLARGDSHDDLATVAGNPTAS